MEQAEEDQVRIRAAVEETSARLTNAEETFRTASDADGRAQEQFQAARSSAADHNAAVALAASRLDGVRAEAQAQTALEQAQDARRSDERALAEATEQLSAHQANDPATAFESSRGWTSTNSTATVDAARHEETQAKLAVRTAEERVAGHETRARDLRATAQAEREARAQALAAIAERRRQAQVATEVLEVAAGAKVKLWRRPWRSPLVAASS